MKKFGMKTLALILVLCFSVPFINVAAADSAVTINISYSGTPQVGETIVVKITTNKPAKDLAGLEFSLNYDSKFVAPTVTENSEDGSGMASIVKKMPSDWEQMCNHSSGTYNFAFAMPESGSSYLNQANALVVEIPFKVVSAGVFDFKIESSSIIAVGADANFTLYNGTGGSISVVAAGQAEKFAVDLDDISSVEENGMYYLSMDVTNLGDNEGIIGLEFALAYDPTVFKPYIIKNDSQQMDEFMVSMPKDSWEQLCTHYPSDNQYILRFAALHAESLTESEILEKGKTMKITVPFYVIGAEGSTAKFTVTSASAIGLNNANGFIVGRGDVKNVSVEKGTSPIPAGLYDIKDGHLLYVKAKTPVAEFLKPLNGLSVTDGESVIENGFVASGNILTNGGGFSVKIVVKGDVNCNGNIDSRDYLLIKRAYFNTVKLNETTTLAGDVNTNGKIDSRDYMLLKRAYFGTYNING